MSTDIAGPAHTYADKSLPWITLTCTTTRMFMVQTSAGHRESDDPFADSGTPVKYRDDVQWAGSLAGAFPDLGSVHLESGAAPVTAIWPNTEHGTWMPCDKNGKPTK